MNTIGVHLYISPFFQFFDQFGSQLFFYKAQLYSFLFNICMKIHLNIKTQQVKSKDFQFSQPLVFRFITFSFHLFFSTKKQCVHKQTLQFQKNIFKCWSTSVCNVYYVVFCEQFFVFVMEFTLEFCLCMFFCPSFMCTNC